MERRQRYRMAKGLEALVASVTAGERSRVAATVLDVSAGGVALMVPVAELGGLETGQEITVHLEVSGAGVDFDMRAVVRHRTEIEGNLSCGVEFREPERLETQLPANLFLIFNRRKAFRVRPADGELVRVRLEAMERGEGCDARLVDISATGLAVVWAVGPGERFEIGDRLTVRLTLPPEKQACVLHGVVRGVREQDDAIRYGIEFVEDATPRFAAQQEHVMNYIMSRQHALLQRRV